ncbi:MAG: HD domain-containing protein, partial [Lachnospiraceae bacterium]|nr:HD domain-containing protein [Lachnospiraceae bacterium]
MGTANLLKLQRKMKKELDADRYRHTLGVMYTAASLAMCYGEDIERAQIAGLLHDCAKCI